MPRDDQKFHQFAEWFATPESKKVALGLPRTQKAWAEQNGVEPRTLRRWKGLEDFNALVARAKDRWERAPESSVPEVDEVDLDPAERDYREVRSSLVEKAKNGDGRSLDTFMKYWGSEFVRRELEQSEKGFSELSDGELVEETLDLVGVERVREWLSRQGEGAGV